MSVKSFDYTKMVLDEATEKFSKFSWDLNEKKVDILKDYCDAIDEVLRATDGESFEVEVDEDTMNIYMTLSCANVVMESEEDKLYKLIDRALVVSFAAAKDCYHVLIRFTFPSVWEKN